MNEIKTGGCLMYNKDVTIKDLKAENDNLRKDIEFLLNRANNAGMCSFSLNRDFGISSNSIVEIAYEKISISDQELPGDESDLMACEKMFEKLPTHRKTESVVTAIGKARRAI